MKGCFQVCAQISPIQLGFSDCSSDSQLGFTPLFLLFTGHPKRILYWFDRFAGAGQTEHLLGARALANFAFRNRDLCWHRLAWEGQHAHSPSTVAAKPHYFMELDVIHTVHNFLDHVPEFWRSKELRDSLKSEMFWSIDIPFFAEYLAKKLSRALDSDTADAEEIWAAVRDYLRSEPFSILCQQLLHVVSDEKLLMFINDLSSALSRLIRNYEKALTHNTSPEKATTTHNTGHGKARKRNWMEVMVFAAVQWDSLAEPIFCNACIQNGRRLLHLLQEEEHEEEANSLKRLVNMNECAAGDEGKAHWALRDKISRMDKTDACKYVALEAWVLFYRLSSESTGADLFEGLLEESGIQYRHHSFTREDVNTRENKKKRSKKSRKHSRKKKHRRRESTDEEDDSRSDAELPKEEERGWLLSIDNYTLTWTKVCDDLERF